jgi:hypothetical protein
MASWPIVEPEGLSCPALFYAGTKNPLGSRMISSYEARIGSSGSSSVLFEGLDHHGEFDRVSDVFPVCFEFLHR